MNAPFGNPTPAAPPPRVSVVIPVYNEEANLGELCTRLVAALEAEAVGSWECLLVDDGSRDDSARRMEAQAAADPRFRALRLRRNYGQTAAMQAGIDHARGEVIVPMDADLQNDPADIPALLAKLEEGYEVVSGWRRERQDKKWSRVFVSRVANRVISAISGVRLHDYGCSLKAYRREVLAGVRLYGEMHRFIPIYAAWEGARVTEMPVQHHPRTRGQSNYGLERIFKVILDLLVVKFLDRYFQKPMYVFGGIGLLLMVLGGLAFLWMMSLKLFAGIQLTGTPLPLATVFLGSLGVVSVLLGLLAELVIRTYYESQGKRTYLLRPEERGGEGTTGEPGPVPRPEEPAAGIHP
jgi:glycosyltransferase involved in cell wall biosynthesis